MLEPNEKWDATVSIDLAAHNEDVDTREKQLELIEKLKPWFNSCPYQFGNARVRFTFTEIVKI